jgi:hypothetical protein
MVATTKSTLTGASLVRTRFAGGELDSSSTMTNLVIASRKTRADRRVDASLGSQGRSNPRAASVSGDREAETICLREDRVSARPGGAAAKFANAPAPPYAFHMAMKSTRPGLEVFVNEVRSISIRQDLDGQPTDGWPMVVIDPDDVSTLIRALETARREVRGAALPEREDVTVPALVHPRRPVGST